MASSQSVVFIDPSIAEYQKLINRVEPGTLLFIFDTKLDKIRQITNKLTQLTNIASLEIISPSTESSLQLSSTVLNSANIKSYSSQLQQWGKSLNTAGTDTIQSSITYSLATLANIENLTLTGTANINGTGNAANNVITGNTGNNTLNGGAGTDTLIGGLGNDIYIVDSTTDTIRENANAGTDTIQSIVTYSLATLANIENLTLTGTANINGTGNAANNIITGNAGNNTLNGGTGTDTLIGGLGNDIYIVDSTTDTIRENANAGTDTIQSIVTYSLATLANIENLTLTGTANINGTGNAANNIITGNTGNNILTGATGKDTLTGGLGIDHFDYRTLADSVLNSFDVIADFNANTGNDLFLVSTTRSQFSNAGTVATLDTVGITATLTTTSFIANAAAQFTFGSSTFVAINDGTDGFSAVTDAIIDVTGLIGTLTINNFTTVVQLLVSFSKTYYGDFS